MTITLEQSMPINVKLSESLVDKARTSAQVHQRTISEQIEYWSKIGRIAEDNPDLTFTLVQEIMAADLEPTVGEYVYS
jgi:hypothetical protein